ncbi:MAG: hypothetical protein ACYDDV_11275 [Methanoregula sp.]|jgi:hypothetical protein|nr:MAG: hypothetical protein CVV30_08310 [Methanomicrobiales archaeon HGW-Methanomicrobiales-1]
MRTGDHLRNLDSDDAGVATMIEYILISGILMILFVVMLLLVNANFMQGPVNTLTYSAFTDISNGISTRIVDTYAIAPVTGNITSRFDIPDDVAGRGYYVEIGNTVGSDPTTQTVTVSGGMITTNVAIAGIGSTQRAMGNTTGTGLNMISFDSRGF